MSKIFISVGRVSSPEQEAFVSEIESILRGAGFDPRALNRTDFANKQPLLFIEKLMNTCDGAVIIAFERTMIENGMDLRGSDNPLSLQNVRLTTPWNQIEAALAYAKRLPLLVICENGLRQEGLLEANYDWYVQEMNLDPAHLRTKEFNGRLSNWSEEVRAYAHRRTRGNPALLGSLEPNSLSIGQFFWMTKRAHILELAGAAALLLSLAVSLTLYLS